jgi:hypothetical protein
MTPTDVPHTTNLPGWILLILLLAIPLAFLVSIGLLSLYRRAVRQAMHTRASSGLATKLVPLETSAPRQEPVNRTPNIVVLDSGFPMTAEIAGEYLYADLMRSPWRAATLYTLAGLCYAAVMASVFLVASKIEFLPLRFITFLWMYAWPVVLTLNIVAAATWRTKLMISSAYFIILAALAAIAAVKFSGLVAGQIILLWLFVNLPASVLLLAFLNRRIRAVGPLVLIVMLLAVTGANLSLLIAGNNSSIVKLGTAVGLDGFWIFIGIVVVGFAIFGLFGWLILQGIVNGYRRKKISDQSITLDSIWLLYGVFQSVDLIFQGTGWLFAGLLAFIGYKVVVSLGFSFLGKKTHLHRKNPHLLLLRVFSLGKRSERLFDVLAIYWRYIGSIRLITGPDLATTTFEPHEFLDFLSGKLSRRFIDNSQTLDLRISEMELAPDHDGRFRVNDFFCHEDTWRMVLSRLVGASDVVLMDLRGFSARNSGCIFEIRELINVMPLGRVVFVIDDTTDGLFLRGAIQESWDQMRPMSPNSLLTSGSLRLFRLTGLRNHELRPLLRILCDAGSASPEAQVLA